MCRPSSKEVDLSQLDLSLVSFQFVFIIIENDAAATSTTAVIVDGDASDNDDDSVIVGDGHFVHFLFPPSSC